MPHRPLREIANDIFNDWFPKVYFGAMPYLKSMRNLDQITDSDSNDSAKSVVSYFLANAGTWKGPVARQIKAELKAILKDA